MTGMVMIAAVMIEDILVKVFRGLSRRLTASWSLGLRCASISEIFVFSLVRIK